MPRLRLVLLAAATIAAGCYKDDVSSPSASTGKPIKVLITDAPFPFDTVQSVDVYIISIAASPDPDTGTSADSMSWVTITEPHRSVNLLELQRGTTALLGEGELPADQYSAIRVIIDTDSSAVRFVGGSPAAVHWGGAGRQAIHAFVESAVNVPNEGTEIVIDFDVGRSFQYNNFGDGAFNFIAWIRAVNRSSTGSIAGMVRQDTSAGTPGPVPGMIVRAWGASQGNWQVFTTGTTDATGHYRLAYLRAGTYIVSVDPSPPSDLAAKLDSNVVVNAGAETIHDVTLSAYNGALFIAGATSMLVGRTNRLETIVINSQHQQDPSAAVGWQNLDTAVVGLVVDGDTSRVARVTAKLAGSGRIVATSGALADTLVIQVVADTSSGAPVPR
jgi:uncharacterized protein DUF4382